MNLIEFSGHDVMLKRIFDTLIHYSPWVCCVPSGFCIDWDLFFKHHPHSVLKQTGHEFAPQIIPYDAFADGSFFFGTPPLKVERRIFGITRLDSVLAKKFKEEFKKNVDNLGRFWNVIAVQNHSKEFCTILNDVQSLIVQSEMDVVIELVRDWTHIFPPLQSSPFVMAHKMKSQFSNRKYESHMFSEEASQTQILLEFEKRKKLFFRSLLSHCQRSGSTSHPKWNILTEGLMDLREIWRLQRGNFDCIALWPQSISMSLVFDKTSLSELKQRLLQAKEYALAAASQCLPEQKWNLRPLSISESFDALIDWIFRFEHELRLADWPPYLNAKEAAIAQKELWDALERETPLFVALGAGILTTHITPSGKCLVSIGAEMMLSELLASMEHKPLENMKSTKAAPFEEDGEDEGNKASNGYDEEYLRTRDISKRIQTLWED